MGHVLASKEFILKSPNGTCYRVTIDDNGKIKQEKYDSSDPYVDYDNRNKARDYALNKGSMDMVAYFMGLGDDQATAEGKVGQISDEIADLMFQYTKGRTQPLIDKINASTLPFMDATAKSTLIAILTV